MANQPSALTSALGTAPTPKESDPLGLVEQLGKKEDPMARGRFAYEQAPALLKGKGEAEGESARAEFGIQQGQARKAFEAEEQMATEARKQYGNYEAGLKAPGEFQVPEYTASDYAKGAAQRLVSAFLIGGLTKQSATAQLQMIRSMQDAEDRGLDTEFQAARMKFDEAEKAKDKHNKRLKERFDSLMDLASKDRTAALAQAKLIEADVGEGLIAAKIRAGQWGEAYKLFNNAMENLDKLKLEQAKTAAKPTKVEQLPSDLSKTFENVGTTNSALARADQTRKPEFFGIAPVRAVADAIISGVEKGLPVGDVVNAIGGNKYPKVTREAVNWWKDYYSFIAQVRNKLFGATLTSREAADFDRFTVSPATDPQQAELFFNNQRKIISDAIAREKAKGRARGVSEATVSAYLDLPTDEVVAPAPAAKPTGGPRPPAFANEAEAQAAFDRKEIKEGDEIIVGGRRATF